MDKQKLDYKWHMDKQKPSNQLVYNTPMTYRDITQKLDYKWQWCLNGDWHSLTVNTVEAPNWIQRTLIRWCFAIHWRSIKRPA